MTEYFVSVIDGTRIGYLLGPYPDHATALENVELGRQLAEVNDLFACFYAYGTCSAPTGLIKKTVFGGRED